MKYRVNVGLPTTYLRLFLLPNTTHTGLKSNNNNNKNNNNKVGKLKRETESLIIAAQDQTIRTNYVKATIDKSQDEPKCRMCKQNNETISHIVSGCPKLAQKEYKKRHDNVARAIHWDLSEKYGFERSERWYDHVPDSVLKNEDYKMLWDFSVRTDHEIEARRPDLLIIDKNEKNCQIIDVAIP